MKLVLNTTLKRQNSTFQPIFGDAFDFTFTDIKFRTPTSIHAPVFIVRPQTVLNTETMLKSECNYAGFFFNDSAVSPDYFLWVNDIIVNTDGTLTVACSVDVLAQYKTEILEATLFVLRSASTRNVKLGDSASPTLLDDVSTSVPIPQTIFANNFNNGAYVVGILNDDVQAVGVPHYYVMTQTEWSSFTQSLLSSVDWLAISPSEISSELQKALVNPMQYITSAMWLPVPVQTSDEQLTAIPVGFWEIPDSSAKRWTGAFTVKTFNVTLPMHPQAAALEFLNYPPYSNFRLTLEPFGNIDLPGWVQGGTTISGLIYVDPSTGDASLHLTAENSVIGTFYAKVGVELQIGQTVADFSQLNKTDLIESGLAAVSGIDNFFGVGAIENVASGVMSGLTARATAVQSSGTRGSIAAYIDVPRVVGVFKRVSSVNYNSVMGRPLCTNVKLSTLSGFTLCAAGEIQVSASPAERAAIKNYLTTGFFIE